MVKALELLDESRGTRGAAGAGPFAGLRPHRCPPRRAPGDGRLLVATGRDHPGGGNARYSARSIASRPSARAWWAFGCPPSDRSTRRRARRYDKLRQVRWQPRMAATGYLGGHMGPDSPLFLRKYVVPLLAGRSGDSAVESRFRVKPTRGGPISIWPGQRGSHDSSQAGMSLRFDLTRPARSSSESSQPRPGWL